MLSGLLSQVGLREAETREFLGARGAQFMIFPGSPLAKKPPRWVMAAELVETSRLWARTVARIQPEWIEPLAGHLVKRTYSEPHWSRKRAGAVAVERVTLHGIPIVVGRNVDLGRIDPELARELFLRHALVEGDWDTRHAFFAANRALLDDVEELETRARRRDLVVDEDTLFAFYDARVPAEVVSGRHFDSWWKKARRRQPDLLDLTAEFLTTEAAKAVDASAYPDAVEAGGLTLPLSYAFEPGRETDGITVDVPVAALHQVDPTPFTWQVPGLREELVTALIKTLPKQLRRHFAPAPDHARAVLARLQAGSEPLLDGLERELGRMRNVTIPRDAWELDRLPDHLTVTFRVVDERGREVARGTDLEKLRHELAPKVREELATAGADIEATGLTTWSIGDAAARDRGAARAARRHRLSRPGRPRHLGGRPRLPDRRRARPGAPARRPAAAAARDPVAGPRGHPRTWTTPPGWPCPAPRTARSTALLDDCVTASVDALITAAGGPAWDEASYAKLRAVTRAKLESTTVRVLDAVRAVLTVWHRVQARITDLTAPVLAEGAPRPHAAGERPDRARVRHRGGHRPARRPRPLPAGRRAADRQAARRPGPRRAVDGARYGSSPTSTRPSWPPCPPGSSRRRSCARSAG